MKILHVKVANKIATLQDQEDAYIVCGNAGYQIQFDLDEEWEGVQKTARFIWSGKYHDVEFQGDTCEAPVVSGTQVLSVGLYAGEVPTDEQILSSTLVTIPCRLSTRCHQVTAQSASGENYTNEARGYAAEAKASAESAEASAQRVENKGKLYWHHATISNVSTTVEYTLDYYSTGKEPFHSIYDPYYPCCKTDIAGNSKYGVMRITHWADDDRFVFISYDNEVSENGQILLDMGSDTVREV